MANANPPGLPSTIAGFSFAFYVNVPSTSVTAANQLLSDLQAKCVPGSGIDDRRVMEKLGELEAILNFVYGGGPAVVTVPA
jgi:hypothetical protein